MRRLCVTETNLGQRKHNEFRACALLVSIALDWRWSDVPLVSKFTRGKTFIFSNMQKMSLTHTVNEKRLSDVLVKSPTICDARPANHNALTKILHYLVCLTCVMVCVTGSLDNSIIQSACQVHLTIRCISSNVCQPARPVHPHIQFNAGRWSDMLA